MEEFQAFDKIPRLRRKCVITEKIDGTNAQVLIPDDDGPMQVGSRNRWITPDNDNYGFARWAFDHEAELRRLLGPGRHFGEWWGSGIQRRYGLTEKRFSLFNVGRWVDLGPPVVEHDPPVCCSIVPVLYRGEFSDSAVQECLDRLRRDGSVASPGFMDPEGIVVFHAASRTLHKVTLGDDGHKEARGAA
jgi:hypothetical protein